MSRPLLLLLFAVAVLGAIVNFNNLGTSPAFTDTVDSPLEKRQARW